jgi:NADPH2:quinone reductase
VKAIAYSRTGDPDVLSLLDRPVPEPGPGEVRVRVHVSGVNPTDWKSRRGGSPAPVAYPLIVPHHDGAGVVDAVGVGVTRLEIGQRVWIYEANWQRPEGTAQEYVVLPETLVVALPDDASFELGASLGVPALTAHRCLTVSLDGPRRLGPGALAGRRVLVAGGAGAVGNAAIQLARWAGADVIATVSSEVKAELARRGGAQHVVDYRAEDAVAEIRRLAPAGVDIVVEVSPSENALLDREVVADHATVSVYANNGGDELTLSVRPLMLRNANYQFIVVLKVMASAKCAAIEDVSAAVAQGAFRVGAAAGVPLHCFPLARTADAHAAVEGGAVGRVLVEVV